MDEAGATRVPATMPGRSRSLLSCAYGFCWWTNGVMATGKRRYPAAPPTTRAAHGASRNFCFVIPEWNMVIVLRGNSDLSGTNAEQDEMVDTFYAKLDAAFCGNDGKEMRR